MVFWKKSFFVSPAYDRLDVRSQSRCTRVSAMLPNLLSTPPACMFYSSRFIDCIQITTRIKYVFADASGLSTYFLIVFKWRYHSSKRQFCFLALFWFEINDKLTRVRWRRISLLVPTSRAHRPEEKKNIFTTNSARKHGVLNVFNSSLQLGKYPRKVF